MTHSSHSFHIPVMGTGFTIDAPLKVARYGISSVISLVDDVLIEQMRKFYCEKIGEPYEEIRSEIHDSRALRITSYLNLVHRLVQEQVHKLQSSRFEPGSEITRYFEMLPESSLKNEYRRMASNCDPVEKLKLQEELRSQAVPGSMDVNIMTNLDRDINNANGLRDPLFSDAMSALRGYANSTLESAVVFSAGLNQHLYSYLSKFSDFLPREGLPPKKSIILKVSDYRSAEIQGKFLAKRGLWVSEYRIESGLNCGGHAFVNKGHLLGPILEDFKRNRKQLVEKLYPIYRKALSSKNLHWSADVPKVRITVQGGIGTFDEDQLLRHYFEVDGTGWGTPFLLVPEVTNVDDYHLKKLAEATEKDVYLSDSSPLNVPFWMLRTSRSEDARRRRIEEDKPGSACAKGYLASSTEFTRIPICSASYAYQKLKLNQLSNGKLTQQQFQTQKENITSKSCVCHDLAGGATVKYGIDLQATAMVCCGPNIANFSKIVSLEEMVNHIYGRTFLITNPGRKHMFVRELFLNIDYFRKEIEKVSIGTLKITSRYLHEFKQNMLDGIEYYKKMVHCVVQDIRDQFRKDLAVAEQEIESLYPQTCPLLNKEKTIEVA